jgi:cytochrome c
VKTVGSYWPYASTVYDYVYRAMPFGEAQSLTHDETYQVVAYILYMSDVIDDEFVLSNETIGSVKMPNQNGFMLPDPRPDGQLASAPCMQNCEVPTKIIGRARIIDVTPDKE